MLQTQVVDESLVLMRAFDKLDVQEVEVAHGRVRLVTVEERGVLDLGPLGSAAAEAALLWWCLRGRMDEGLRAG